MRFHVRVIAESSAERASREVNGPSEGGEMRRMRNVSGPKIETRMSTATDRGLCRGALPAAQHSPSGNAQRRRSMNQPKAYTATASQIESGVPMRSRVRRPRRSSPDR